MAPLTWWTWVWASSRSCWWTRKTGVLQAMGSQRVWHDWATELNFFLVQLLHPYTTTGKTIALTRQTFVSKEMSLLFNSLSRLVIAFLPKSKCLLISWLQSPSTNIYNSFFLISRTSQQLKNPSMHKFWYVHTIACVYAKSLQSCPTLWLHGL